MCRMYASLGPPGPPAEELERFARLCRGGCGGPHDSGWGMVGFAARGQAQALVKSTLPASEDPGVPLSAVAMQPFPVVLAHLRKASVGGVSLENTHPFVEDGLALGHNGTIHGDYPAKLGEGHGHDSRTLFARVLAGTRRGWEAGEALAAAVREVRAGGWDYSSVTVLLTDGATLWAARDVRRDHAYYELKWQAQKDGRLVFCQEPILPGAWSDLPNGHLAVARAGRVELTAL